MAPLDGHLQLGSEAGGRSHPRPHANFGGSSGGSHADCRGFSQGNGGWHPPAAAVAHANRPISEELSWPGTTAFPEEHRMESTAAVEAEAATAAAAAAMAATAAATARAVAPSDRGRQYGRTLNEESEEATAMAHSVTAAVRGGGSWPALSYRRRGSSSAATLIAAAAAAIREAEIPSDSGAGPIVGGHDGGGRHDDHGGSGAGWDRGGDAPLASGGGGGASIRGNRTEKIGGDRGGGFSDVGDGGGDGEDFSDARLCKAEEERGSAPPLSATAARLIPLLAGELTSTPTTASAAETRREALAALGRLRTAWKLPRPVGNDECGAARRSDDGKGRDARGSDGCSPLHPSSQSWPPAAPMPGLTEDERAAMRVVLNRRSADRSRCRRRSMAAGQEAAVAAKEAIIGRLQGEVSRLSGEVGRLTAVLRALQGLPPEEDVWERGHQGGMRERGKGARG